MTGNSALVFFFQNICKMTVKGAVIFSGWGGVQFSLADMLTMFLSVPQVMTMDDGKAKGFGFVSFEDHEAAAKVFITCY